MKNFFTSEAHKISCVEDIMNFTTTVAQRKFLSNEELLIVMKDITSPMVMQYMKDPKGKDYIAFTEGMGFCFLAESEVIRKRPLAVSK